MGRAGIEPATVGLSGQPKSCDVPTLQGIHGSPMLPDNLRFDEAARTFTPLIDAKAAAKLLGVPAHLAARPSAREAHPAPSAWALRAFSAEDLRDWLRDTRIRPAGFNRTAER